jgi:predicted ABC-type ATPase
LIPSNLYLIAGANGSGKTTFAREFLPKFVHCREFLNADLMAEGISPFAPEAAAVRAGRLLLERIGELSAEKKDFGFETTLAGKSYAKTFRRMKEQGYAIHCYFLWLPSVEMAVARVKHRVSQGGHDIPEPIIRRRYAAGLRNFFTIYRPLFDSWIVYNNSMVPPQKIAFEEQRRLTVINQAIFQRVQSGSEHLAHE